MVRIQPALRMGKAPFVSDVAVPVGGPTARMRTLGPFAVVSCHHPHEWPPGMLPVDADIRPHPHMGIVAITYVLQGHMTHRDSLGSRQEAGPGAINAMVCGRGVVHSERYERARVLGGTLAHVQLLAALPDGNEDAEPSFTHIAPEDVPVTAGEGVTVKMIADSTPGARSALSIPMPAFVHDVHLDAGGRYSPPDGFSERALYVLSGAIEIEGQRVEARHSAVLTAGPAVVTGLEASRAIAIGGEPCGPRFGWWNLFHSSMARIDEVKAAWRAGKMTLPPGDTESFAPAPPDEGRPLYRFNPAE